MHHPRGGLAYIAAESPGWFQISDYNLGNINNWGGHMLDIAQWALGTEHTGPVEVSGRAEFPTDSLWDVPRNFVVRYRYANGVEIDYTDSDRAWSASKAARAGLSTPGSGPTASRPTIRRC